MKFLPQKSALKQFMVNKKRARPPRLFMPRLIPYKREAPWTSESGLTAQLDYTKNLQCIPMFSKYIQNIGTTLLLFIVLCFPPFSHARLTTPHASGPLKTRVQNPLYLQFITQPIESTQTLKKKHFETSLETAFSNIFEFEPTGGSTSMRIDMEQWRTALTLGYGVRDNLDLKLEIPFISSSAGFLDGFVQGYHGLFGFPNGGRNRVPDYEYRFQLTHNGTALTNHQASPFGPSDMILRGKYLLPIAWPVKVAVVPALKIPTGKITGGLSSGHFDLGATVLVEKNLKRFHFVSQLGGAWINGHNNMEVILKKYLVQFGQSAEWQIADGVSLIAQLTGNTSLFKDVRADELTKIALDLNIGFAGTFPLKEHYFDEFYYQFSFGEDVIGYGPSVDFTTLFLVGVRY